jgi:carbon monoxide dehydrogenase subunit G
MKSALKKVVFAILVLPILIILAAFFLPSRYKVERSLLIQAKPDAIFPLLNDLKRWPEWTAWNSQREPSLVYAYPGPVSAGVGAVQSWTAQSGNGSIKLTAADPLQGVAYELNFNEGRFISTGRIQLLPADQGTRVVWTNEGDLGSNPVGRYLGLLMDKWMGADFELGLQNLKAKTEPPRM